MQEAQNTKVVQDVYAAFGRGDIPSILDNIADDVVWHAVYGAGAHVPHSGERRGKPAFRRSFSRWLSTSPAFRPSSWPWWPCS